MAYLLDFARHNTDQRDIVVLATVERFRHACMESTPTAVAKTIRGASTERVAPVMVRLMHEIKALEIVADRGRLEYAVSPLGAELLTADVEGWTPSPREQARRDASLRSAAAI